MSVSVPLTRGLVAIIDEADLAIVNQFKWHVNPRHSGCGGFYAVSGRGGAAPTLCGRVYMHRLIFGAPEGVLVDHINRDGLDNRRCNLRAAERWQNNVNKIMRNMHGYRGVERTRSGKWRAKLRANGVCYSSRPLPTLEDAARAHDELAIVHQGPFAVLNFPEQGVTA